MTRCPNHNPVQPSPHNTGNRDPEFIQPGVKGKVWWQRWLLAASILALGMTGCSNPAFQDAPGSPEPSPQTDAATVQEFMASPDLSSALQQALRVTQVKARRMAVPADGVAIALYIPDNQCLTYVTEEVVVSRNDGLTETVELILAEQQIPFFYLTGYRLNRNPDTKTVTIDLRVSRTSPRLLQSLSFCEQKFLFGSIRETLLNHPEWDIDQVEFTNRGNRLVL